MILVLDRLDFSVVEAACLNITFVLNRLENGLLFSLRYDEHVHELRDEHEPL